MAANQKYNSYICFKEKHYLAYLVLRFKLVRLVIHQFDFSLGMVKPSTGTHFMAQKL